MCLCRAGLGDLETGVRARSDERGLSLHQGFHVGQLEVSQVFPWIFLGLFSDGDTSHIISAEGRRL